MDLTPRSIRSPVSPYNQHPKQLFTAQTPCYPNSPRPESATTSPNQNRGLGLFGYPVPQPQSSVHEMPPSPQPSGSWSRSPVMGHDFPQSSQPPDIFTAAFDPFSGFNAASTTGMPDAPGLAYYHHQSPSDSQLPSHRSSDSSSYSPSESFSPNGSDFLPAPAVKVEDSSEWYYPPGNEHSHGRPLITQDHSPYSQGMSPMSPPVEYPCRDPSWSRTYTHAYPMDLRDASDARPSPVILSGLGVDPPRKTRKPTTLEEATHECQVCGKLFKRSYNYKSHMETHNPQRKYPHPCTAMVGNTRCVKKFQRKTDLDRHNDSVHLKARNHQCSMCGNRFARRDTLRRHTEDGCPKRFELGFREGSPATPARLSLTNFPRPNRGYSLAIPHSSTMSPSPSTVPSTTFCSYERTDFTGAAATTPTMYTS